MNSGFKVMLINSPINSGKVLGKFSGIRNTLNMVPSGIGYIAAVLEKNNIAVSICDAYSLNLSKEDLLVKINEENPSLIGIGATTTNINTVFDIVAYIKSNRPYQRIVLGGIHPSAMPEEALATPSVDFVIREEGEYPMLALCRALETNFDFSAIEGLSWKKNGSLIHNKIGNPIEDLDQLPFPSYHMLPMDKYSAPAYMLLKKPVFQMIASRGCPNRCIFCINAEKYKAKKYRSRSIDNVIEEMVLLKNRYGAKQIMFWDPHFPVSRKQALDFSEKIIKKKLSEELIWSSTTRVEVIDKEVSEKLHESGCRALGFGIESGNERLLKNVGKFFTLAQAKEAVYLTSDAGIMTIGSFILGLPEETFEETRATIEFAKELDLDFAQFSLLIPYPGTPIFDKLVKEGKLRNFNWDLYNQSAGLSESELIYVPEKQSAKDLIKMQRSAYKEFYFRKKLILRHLKRIGSFSSTALYINSLMTLLKL